MDRRIQKTQVSLVRALRQLMQRYPWSRVSVAMICQEANLARSTYYAHFANKQELLELSIANLAEELTPDLSTRGLDSNGRLRFLPLFLEHVQTHRDIYLCNRSSTDIQVILENMRQMTLGLIRREALESSCAGNASDDKLRFVGGGLSALIEHWNLEACVEPQALLLERLDKLTQESFCCGT